MEGICVKDEKPPWKIDEMSKHDDKLFAQIHEDSVPMLIDIGFEETFAAFVPHSRFTQIKHGDKILLVIRANHIKIRPGKRGKEKRNAIVGKIYHRIFA